VYECYSMRRCILFFSSLLLTATNLAVAAPRCNLVVGPSVHFKEQDSARDIPNNEDALYCALTVVRIPPFVGGGGMTGGCIVRKDSTTHHWTLLTVPPGIQGIECEVTCIKAIDCKGEG
jgi:hypothetical protein